MVFKLKKPPKPAPLEPTREEIAASTLETAVVTSQAGLEVPCPVCGTRVVPGTVCAVDGYRVEAGR